MLLQQWIILFTTACFGNMLGLNISAGMRTAVSIYILIPLILVPQLLLGGAMIKFDDLHKSISKKIYVPLAGDIMGYPMGVRSTVCLNSSKVIDLKSHSSSMIWKSVRMTGMHHF